MQEFDFLIVGKGLAGSILAFHLIQEKQNVAIIDSLDGRSSSQQAAGLVNPITGRRFVKSWKIEELFPSALSFYSNLERELNTSFLKETSVLKVLLNREQQNDFASKCTDPIYTPYMNSELIRLDKEIPNPFACVEIKPVLQIEVQNLIRALKTYLNKACSLYQMEFIHENLSIQNKSFQYDQIKSKRIIFCEGNYVSSNLFFNYLPNRFAKGEALIIKAPELKLNLVLSSHINICPLGKDKYYVGATYNWDDRSLKPSEEKKAFLIERLESSINCTYEILEQIAGIRPTVLDRRPLLGEHPKHQGMYIFNGMGTKGLSLAPYFSKQLVDCILHQGAIEPEVNINRFS
ncbi:MAG: FAD-binding oxidoreductase [Chitinophagales bacterium]|nr:FAD-binding oxidoreductase [Chitinophagales bacterium]